MVRFSIREEEEAAASYRSSSSTSSGSQPPPPPRRATMGDLIRSYKSRRPPPTVRSSIREDDEFDSSDDDDVSIRHKRPRFSSAAPSGSQPPPPRNEDEDESDSESESESESEGAEIVFREGDFDDDDVEAAVVMEEVQRRTCTASRSLPVVADVAVRRSAVEKSAVTEVGSNASGALSVVFTDPDVLDCPICLVPLCAPVFQCENGHIACDSCCSKVKRKCPSCCMPIGYNRCRAIEKVIESVQVSCRYAQRGCRKTMTYNKKHEHEQLCPYVTCFCPHLSCPFSGSSKDLYLHFGIQHAASTTRFTYNTTFTLPVELNQKHILLQEQHESVVFIVNHEVKEHGRAFNVDCVGPSTLKASFEYQLIAKNTETSLSIRSVPEIYSKWSEHTLKKSYLTVPSDFLGYSGNLSLNVCIKKAILSA